MISSRSNIRVRRLLSLRDKASERKNEKAFLVEGLRIFREVPMPLMREIYVSDIFLKKNGSDFLREYQNNNIPVEILEERLFRYVSDTASPQGVLAVVDMGNGEMITDRKSPVFLMLLDRIQDPGNLGTIFRAGEAAGIGGVILSRGCADLYSPKTVRSTMGSLFRVPHRYTGDMKAEIMRIQKQGVAVYASYLEGGRDYDQEDYRRDIALLVGNEGAGLEKSLAETADRYIRIPMEGKVESLNAAVASSVMMFEVVRQRKRVYN